MPRSGHEDDLPLVRQARQGDFAAFERLVDRHERHVYQLALRIVDRTHDAEDVVQQTFLSVVEHLEGFREEARFRTWLARIATNHALALLRRRKVRQTLPLAEDQGDESYADLPHPQFIATWHETPVALASRRETRALLDAALETLDPKYRVVFVLRDIEGFSTKETAEALQLSQNNVKVRLLRARLMLRERLTRLFGDKATQVTPHHDHD